MEIIPVENALMNSMTYVVYSDDVDYCILIDCGEYKPLKPVLDRIGKNVKQILLTHGHADHIYGLVDLLKDYPEAVVGTLDCGHKELSDSRKNLSFYYEMPFTITNYRKKVLNDGDVVNFGELVEIEVIAAPGHDNSCLCYKIGKNLFTGDAYIPGIKVFSKFPGSNKQKADESREKLAMLEKEGFKIYCGHHDYK